LALAAKVWANSIAAALALVSLDPSIDVEASSTSTAAASGEVVMVFVAC
jgi:hypothetical protein